MSKNALLARQSEMHRIFEERSVLNRNHTQTEEDLRRFDHGIELLLQGKTYRACQESVRNFSTVYGWIKRGNLPMSFRDSATRTKKIKTGKFLKKKQFAYLLGVYQSKVHEINPERLSICTSNPDLEKTVKQSFNTLRIKHTQTTVKYTDRTAKKIYCDSKSLMSFIKEVTEDNTGIPKEFLQDHKMLISYLQGFFDSRAVPSYAPSNIQNSQIKRMHPRITITKSGNTSLLSAVNTALHSLGINSRYNQRKNPDHVVINELESIKKVIDYKLFRNRENIRALKETCTYWKETKKYDNNGKFQRQKDKVRKERSEK